MNQLLPFSNIDDTKNITMKLKSKQVNLFYFNSCNILTEACN